MKEKAMRRPVSKRSYGKKFNKARKRTRAINNPRGMARGGFRL